MNKAKLLHWFVLLTSITQIVSPLLSSFSGNDNQRKDALITPAGYTFAIWGVITLLSLIYGIFQIFPNQKNEQLHLKIAPRLIATYLFFSLWLFSAQGYWLVATVIIFVAMFLNLRIVFESILQQKGKLSSMEKVILEGQIGLYFGWSSIAIFANIAAALKFYGLSDLGISGTIWQSLILCCGLANTIYCLHKTKANYFYGGTIIWAFVGIFFGLRGESDTVFLQIVTISALCAFLSFFYKFNKSKVVTV